MAIAGLRTSSFMLQYDCNFDEKKIILHCNQRRSGYEILVFFTCIFTVISASLKRNIAKLGGAAALATELTDIQQYLPNFRNCKIKQTLICAADRHNMKLLKYLVRRGADINILDKADKNIMDYSFMHKYQPLIDYCRSLGMKPKGIYPSEPEVEGIE